VEREVDPIRRVDRAHDEAREEQEQPQRRKQAPPDAEAEQQETPEGPVEGDDGHLHIDIRA
jgi:hypothetical protein